MMKWVGLIDETNTDFRRIQERLNEQERNLQGEGRTYVALLLILIFSRQPFSATRGTGSYVS